MFKIIARFALASILASRLAVGRICEGCSFDTSALSLLQVSANALHGESGSTRRSSPTCSELSNQGAFYTVNLEVGSPPQPFDVVVDTGSDAVIVPSCLCQDGGECSSGDHCFQGAEQSSTFRIASPDHVPVINMEFGSGSIEATINTDVVRLGSLTTTMSEGLLLMISRNLDLAGSFEGILGLGQLQSEFSSSTSGMITMGDAKWDRPATDPWSFEVTDVGDVPGFLRQAHVDAFSVCFDDATSGGILRLNTERQAIAFPSVGTLHWALNVRGTSIGSSPVSFCGEDEERECGAIPDSGTTVLLGPELQLRNVFSGICEQWPRCKAAAEAEFKGVGEHDVFQRVLSRCEDWLDAEGLDELPSIHFHLGNADSSTRTTIELTPWSYVFKTPADQVDEHTKLLGNIGVSLAQFPQEEERYVCMPAFGTSPYTNFRNGPAWILGMPLFYEYVVGFDRSTSPPEISFSTELCGSCIETNTTQISLARTVDRRQRRAAEVRRAPRKIHGPLRVGRHAVNMPL